MPRKNRKRTTISNPKPKTMHDRTSPNGDIRLNKFLAMAGIGSRRGVEALITSGQVKVNGRRVDHPAYRVNPQRDVIEVQGNPVTVSYVPTYIALNKPPGYITTARDEKGRQTVFKLVQTPMRVFPVGRLDRDSEGLLLFTNDGMLASRLMHPRYKVEKTYLVLLNHTITSQQVQAFTTGVKIGPRTVVKGQLTFPNPANRKFCQVTITEGKYRQIRRMFAALGLRVTALQRIQIGPIKLGHLPPGKWRYLSEKEIKALKKQVGLLHGNQE